MTVVREFHRAFGQPAPSTPSIPSDDLIRLRMRLIAEEFEEVNAELSKLAWQQRTGRPVMDQYGTLGLLLKELADLRYVVEGCAVALGLDIDEAYRRVHASNMSKLGEDGKPVLREDGKALKGPNYFEADVSDLVLPVEGTHA